MAFAPFTGGSVGFACCVEAPAWAGGAGDAVFVAEAYDRTGSCAGTAPAEGVALPEALAGVLAVVLSGFCVVGGTALVIRGGGRG
jgi:hypothetical protein